MPDDVATQLARFAAQMDVDAPVIPADEVARKGANPTMEPTRLDETTRHKFGVVALLSLAIALVAVGGLIAIREFRNPERAGQASDSRVPGLTTPPTSVPPFTPTTTSITGQSIPETLQASLVAEYGTRLLRTTQDGDVLQVVVAANEEELARTLDEQYGDRLELFVGAMQYPIEATEAICAAVPESRGVPPSFELVVEVPPESLRADTATPAVLRATLTNTGDSPLQFETGIPTGVILRRGAVVNANAFIAPEGAIVVELAPGETATIDMLVSTASCDPALGYTLPAGEYELVTTLGTADWLVVSAPVRLAVA